MENERSTNTHVPTRFSRRVASILLLVLVGGIFLASFLVVTGVRFLTRAEVSYTNGNIIIIQPDDKQNTSRNSQQLRLLPFKVITPTPPLPTATPTPVVPTLDPSVCTHLTAGDLSATYLQRPTSQGKTEATISNKSKTCKYKIGLAIYSGYLPYSTDPKNTAWLYTQTYYSHNETVINPGQTLTIAADVPNCRWQADAYQGDVITRIAPGVTYTDQGRLLSGGWYYTTADACPSPTPGDTITPSASPSISPTEGGQPTSSPIQSPNLNATTFEELMTGQGRNTGVLGDEANFIATVKKNGGRRLPSNPDSYLSKLYKAAVAASVNPLAILAMWGVETNYAVNGRELSCHIYSNPPQGFDAQVTCASNDMSKFMKEFENKKASGISPVPHPFGTQCTYNDPFIYAYEYYTPVCTINDSNGQARTNFVILFKEFMQGAR